MRKTIALVFLILFFISSCTNVNTALNGDQDAEGFGAADELQKASGEITAAPTPEATYTPSPLPSPAPTPEPLPEKPKYIFLIIGDGMGYAHLLLGNVYEKILHEDWGYEALWDSFGQQHLIAAGQESSDGGTSLATGYNTKPGLIARTPDGGKLYTIMDRANENGYATGVITNAGLTDATPATFASHAPGRYKYITVARNMAESNVDFLAGGGMRYILDEDSAKIWGREDFTGRRPEYLGSPDIIESFYAQGYTAFWGIDGIAEYESTLDTFDVNHGDKILAMFESSNMLFQSSKYSKQSLETVADEPDLDEMTQSAIDFLSKDDDGFILMIEEALIDKSSHNQDVATVAQEMHMMQKTLGVVFDFYSEHPDDTLIIFTADHECGYYTYTQEGYAEMLALPAIDWHTDSDSLYLMLADECRTYVSESSLRKLMQAGDMDLWGDDDKDYGVVHGLIAETLCKRYGLYSRTGEHSGLPVPCYTQGLKSEVFAEVEHISEIPILICDIMEWEALPEIIDQDNSTRKND